MSNARKIKGPYQVPLYTEMIDGTKRLVGEATVDGEEATFVITDPEALKLLEMPMEPGMFSIMRPE